MNGKEFAIDLSEPPFEHLLNAPIDEAIIHWRARAEKKLEPDAFREQLKAKLPDYPNSQRQQEIGVDAEIGPEGAALHHRQKWHGFRFETADKLQVAQFTRDGFVFSRLSPYEKWEKFQAEAKRLWQVYCELADPSEVQRLGVRFINRIILAEPDRMAELLTTPPRHPNNMNIPITAFMHQNTFEIPDQIYNLNVIQTIQPPSPPETESFSLILDLDVATTQPIQFEEIDRRLLEMQWIKNKAFFSYVTEAALERFRSPKT
jgi:uncharacterized protein (TIGR04255 family)